MELLGQFTDLSVVRRGIKAEWFCMFCKDFAPTPDRVKHKHNCLVARSKDYLAKHTV